MTLCHLLSDGATANDPSARVSNIFLWDLGQYVQMMWYQLSVGWLIKDAEYVGGLRSCSLTCHEVLGLLTVDQTTLTEQCLLASVRCCQADLLHDSDLIL